MFNLLPEQEKKEIIQEYNLRRGILVLIFIFIAGIFAVISIFPSYLLSLMKVAETEQSVDAIKKSSVFKDEENLNTELTQVNLKLGLLQPEDGETYVSDLFLNVINEGSNNIRLSTLQYKNGGKDNNGQISVSGIARDRDSLSKFVSSLEKNKLFIKVDLPVSSFAKEKNADFAFVINGNFK